MNCKNCKHWDTNTDLNHVKDTEIGKCKRVKMFWDSTEWNDDGVRVISNKEDLAFVQDCSDYYAELITVKEFGRIYYSSGFVELQIVEVLI